MPVVLKPENVGNANFSVAFLGTYCTDYGFIYKGNDEENRERHMNVVEEFLSRWQTLDLKVPQVPLQSSYLLPRNTTIQMTNAREDTIKTLRSSLMFIADFCLDFQADDLIAKYFQIIGATARMMSVELFSILLLPCLRAILEARNATAAIDRMIIETTWTPLFITDLSHYQTRYVQKQPSTLVNWTRPRTSCNCSDCWGLNVFLISATQQVGRFPMGNKRRMHLHHQLDGTDCKHET